MIRPNKASVRGSAVVELALVFIPFMFGVLGVMEVGRAMWIYHSIAFSVKRGARFASVHGSRCADASTACKATVADVATTIQQSAIGLDPDVLTLTLMAGDQTLACGTISVCLTNASSWPPDSGNAVGQSITIKGTYGFQPVISVWWPGQHTSTYTLAAKSSEVIEF